MCGYTNLVEKESRTANSRFAKAGVSCYYNSEVLYSSFVHLMKYGAEKPRLHKAAKRWAKIPKTLNKQKNMHLNVINISWECIPFEFEKIKQYTNNEDYGLYQIYGQHSAYGQNSLLYIGKANEQKFGVRLDQRWEFIESSAVPTHVRLGRIIKSEKEYEELEWDFTLWGKMIDTAEKMLIKSHSPAFNKQENTGLFDANLEEQFLILNWDDRGSLLPEISTLRYSFKYWNYSVPLKEIQH